MPKDSNSSCCHTGEFWASSRSLLTTSHQKHTPGFPLLAAVPPLTVSQAPPTHVVEFEPPGPSSLGQELGGKRPGLRASHRQFWAVLTASHKFCWQEALEALGTPSRVGFSSFPVSLFPRLHSCVLGWLPTETACTQSHIQGFSVRESK